MLWTRLSASKTRAPEDAATTLQITTLPLANTARYDSLRATDAAEEIDHA